MKLTNEIKIHETICKDIHELFKTKRADYGATTEELLKRYGPVSMLVFLRTKLERIEKLMLTKKTPNHESARDSILDMANYCIIWLLEMVKNE